MSNTAATATTNGQEGSLNPLQPSEITGEPATNNLHTASDLQATIASWSSASQVEKKAVLHAFEAYYKQAGLEAGKANKTKAKTLFGDPAITNLSNAALAQAARLLQVPEQEIPAHTLRHRVTSPGAGHAAKHVHIVPLLEDIAKHYNGGIALPYVPSVEVTEELQPLVGVVAGTRIAHINPARDNLPLSYDIDVSFRDAEALAKALTTAYVRHGQAVPTSFALPESLKGIVELRLELKNLGLPDDTIVDAFKQILEGNEARLLKVVKHFEVTHFNNGPETYRFGGKVSAFVQVHDITVDPQGAYRKVLASLLPTSIMLGGSLPLPIRHNFEQTFCPRARKIPGLLPGFTPARKTQPWSTIPISTPPQRNLTRTGLPFKPRLSQANSTPLAAKGARLSGFRHLIDESDNSENDSDDNEGCLQGTLFSPSITKAERRAAAKARKAQSSFEGSEGHVAKRPREDFESAFPPLPSSSTQSASSRATTQQGRALSMSGSLDNSLPAASTSTSTEEGEHHLDDAGLDDLRASLPFEVFSTPHLITLIPPSLSSLLVEPPSQHQSSDGRILTLHLTLCDSAPLEVVNVYAPVRDEDRKLFFSSFSFPHRPHHLPLVAGDLNDCPNPRVDRKYQTGHRSHWETLVARAPIHLEDALRLVHPFKALFTRPHIKNKKIVSWSRIDHILIGSKHKACVRDAFINFTAPASDHRPVIAHLDIPSSSQISSLPTTNANSTRIHPSLFSDVHFAVAFETWFHSSLSPQIASLPADYRWETAKGQIAAFASQYARQRRASHQTRERDLESQLQALEATANLTSAHALQWRTLQDELRALASARSRSVFLRTSVPFFPDANLHAQTLHRKLATRKKSTTFRTIQLADSSRTTDIETALAHVQSHFSAQFSPSERDTEEVRAVRKAFLEPIYSSNTASDPRFARRWDPEQAARLDLPFSAKEVSDAIASAPSSSSPGLLGLPYEFYKQNSSLLSHELADAFNAAWERGTLQRSQTEARVRLLFKSSKPNADDSLVSHYRPISLRETDYRLLARVLVKRINPLLEQSIPANQVGFVPGRQSSDAGLHLQLLVEEIQARNIPQATLLSLDQEKAYDLVDHDWVLASYEAFGAPPRFLALLAALYDSSRLVARYNVNGFFTEPVPLKCGLPQGCPLSCASWLLSFQPFLDSLIRRRISLTVLEPLNGIRSEIFTSLAFADDSILVVESLSHALPLLEQLAVDWRLATNGRLNTSKTSAFAIGPAARDDPAASLAAWTRPEESTTWAGFPISLEPQPRDFYEHLLVKLERRCTGARNLYTSLRTRALYANSRIVSLSLHALSFYPAPNDFLTRLRTVLLDFVWGSKLHDAKKKHVFLPVKQGGLGLIDPHDLNEANNLRRLSSFLSNSHPLATALLQASFRRHAPQLPASSPHRFLARNPWSLLRRSVTSFAHPLWLSIAATGSRIHPSHVDLNLSTLTASEVLALPPYLLLPHDALRSFDLVAQLYPTSDGTIRTIGPSYGVLARAPTGIKLARTLWSVFVRTHPIFSRLLPSLYPSVLLPHPVPPLSSFFTIYGLPPAFSTSRARRRLNDLRPPAPLDPKLERLFASPPSSEALVRRTWNWIHTAPATAREAETHWRLLHNGIRGRPQLSHFAPDTDRTCLFCSTASDDVVHALFECDYSKEYWSSLLDLLSSSLSGAFTASTFAPDEILLGLPTLRLLLDDSDAFKARAVVAVGLQTLVDTRRSRIQQNPLLSSPLPSDLAVKAVEDIVRRLS
ncbi:reverse transcriptase family protein [Sporobolomyces koalae]|uniref:reverse transcriptase family protein n=1 Tax=Sporobolomyces koalae TaxID=500713 RepID=UPI00317A544E